MLSVSCLRRAGQAQWKADILALFLWASTLLTGPPISSPKKMTILVPISLGFCDEWFETVRSSKRSDKKVCSSLYSQVSALNECLEICSSWLPPCLMPHSLLFQVWRQIRSGLLGHPETLRPQLSPCRGWLWWVSKTVWVESSMASLLHCVLITHTHAKLFLKPSVVRVMGFCGIHFPFCSSVLCQVIFSLQILKQ